MLQAIDSMFQLHSEQVPDVLLLVPQHGLIISDEEMGEISLVGSQDFLPLHSLSKYSLEKLGDESSLDLTANDGEEIRVNISWKLKGDANNLRNMIIQQIPSLDFESGDGEKNPIFCAVRRARNRCEILGVYLRHNMGDESEPEDTVFAVKKAVDIVIHDIHKVAKYNSKFKVRVHTSIIDRIKGENPSIPVAFLSRSGGALEHPMYIEFSEKGANSINIIQHAEFTIFRDDFFIYMTSFNRKTSYSNWIRIPLDTLEGSNGRFNNERVRIALREGMGLNRSRTGPSMPKIQRRLSEDKVTKSEELFTRVGIGLKLSAMNCELDSKLGASGQYQVQTRQDHAQSWDYLAPLLLHLCLARLDPELRGELKKLSGNRIQRNRNGRTRAKKSSQLLEWGSDRIRYVMPDLSGEGGVSKHWVNAHVRELRIKKEKTVETYRKNKWPIVKNGDFWIGHRMIRGHYRGTGDMAWDGDFKFGKTPSYYSAKSLRWLSSLSEKLGIKIQHAEKGGEKRIPITGGYIQVDGYCCETNTVFEFHGDVYHGNPKKFDRDERCHPFDKSISAGELYDKTIQREEVIRSLGFNLVSIWETDWDMIESGD